MAQAWPPLTSISPAASDGHEGRQAHMNDKTGNRADRHNGGRPLDGQREGVNRKLRPLVSPESGRRIGDAAKTWPTPQRLPPDAQGGTTRTHPWVGSAPGGGGHRIP